MLGKDLRIEGSKLAKDAGEKEDLIRAYLG
jgi:hypothetical protein